MRAMASTAEGSQRVFDWQVQQLRRARAAAAPDVPGLPAQPRPRGGLLGRATGRRARVLRRSQAERGRAPTRSWPCARKRCAAAWPCARAKRRPRRRICARRSALTRGRDQPSVQRGGALLQEGLYAFLHVFGREQARRGRGARPAPAPRRRCRGPPSRTRAAGQPRTAALLPPSSRTTTPRLRLEVVDHARDRARPAPPPPRRWARR